MGHIPTLQSLIAGRWHGAASHTPLHSALDSTLIYHTHAEKIDFDEALTFARKTGVKALMRQTFQERAAALKALALYLMERKEELYAISHLTGATRQDSWVDVEGGIGTLFAYASMGSRELPSSNVLHEGPAIALGKRGGFAGTHILVPRGGVAVHINAFNFPIWGLLEKFAPSFLAAMPCIAKPATATSYLTHAVVKMMVDSNLLPDGALQLVIGSTGDLLDRLGGFDAVTFTGSADTAAMLRANGNLIRASVPFTAEADSLNCAVLAPDVTPSDPEFDLFIKEVAREMTGKAGQKCTAIRRVIVPEALVDAVGERLRDRLAKITVGDPKVEGVRMGALASMDQHRDVSARVELLARGNEVLFGARDGFKPVGENVASGAFFSPTLLLCRNAMVNDAVHDVEAFGPVSTLMTYTDIDEALELAARGKGSLVTTFATIGTAYGADRGGVTRPRADP
jgi:oxepin-CoA hydrolase/3-oxo-5,6-dehydrosuberyl-CoA semialdehyde dehydrogenase